MGIVDKRIDTYISKAADFAKPILNHLRRLIHDTCPDIEETIKWGFPHFNYKGILCSMAAFKQHCAFGFWKGTLLSDAYNVISSVGETAMGQFGQIKSITDLPSDNIIKEYIQEAMKLNQNAEKIPRKIKSDVKKELDIPDYFKEAINKNNDALKTFENFSYSNKKEYIEWIAEAKSDDTRLRRLNTALEWMAEGKIRNWKHIKK